MQEEKSHNHNLEIMLETASPYVALGEPVLVDVTLRNIGDAPMTINGRLLLNSKHAPAKAREIAIEVDGPPNYFSTIKFHVNAGPPKPQHFFELKAGESICKTYDVTEFFSLHLPGKYHLRAFYSNTTHIHMFGRMAWTGNILSNTILIERLSPAH
jgi:hypothetical protein